MARRKSEVDKLRRQVRKLQNKNNLLQLYPANRGLLRPLKRAASALQAAAGEPAAMRSALDAFFANIPAPPADAPRSLVVGGPVRSGKSTVSRLVCLQSSARYLPFDLLNSLWVGRDRADRDETTLSAIVDALCDNCQRGMVIEGTALIFNGMRTAAQMIELLASRGIATVLVGSAEASVEDKMAALLAHHAVKQSWTEKLDDDGLRLRAEQIVSLSVASRRIAGEVGIPYFELRPESYARDLRHAVNTIIDAYGLA